MRFPNNDPLMSASIFYYDIQYTNELATQVLDILTNYRFFPPERIYADKLTKNRYICADSYTSNLFVSAYSEKNVFQIDMVSGDDRKVSDYWKVNWMLTYHKNHRLVGNGKFMPWNVLTVQSTYGRLQDADKQRDYLACIKELIIATKAFYASIDDVSVKVALQDRAGVTAFSPGQIPIVYWGNFWGNEILERFPNTETMLARSSVVTEKFEDGCFFALSKSVHDYNTEIVVQKKNSMQKYLFK